MSSLISFLILIAAIAVIFFAVRGIIAYSKKKDYKPAISKMFYSLIAFVVLIIILIPFSGSSDKKDSSSSSSSSKSMSKSESQKKASEDSYSKELSSARKKNSKINLKQLKEKIKGIPANSNGTIDNATYEDGSVNIILSDSAVSTLDDSSLKSTCYDLWKNVKQLANSYNQEPSSILIKDSSGHIFSSTTMFGDFKFDGK